MTAPARQGAWIARAGLVAGPLAFAAMLAAAPLESLTPAGQRTAAVALWMAFWWITEAIPVAATALLPLALFPPLDILDGKAAAAPYANDLVFLSLGGFLIALAMERCGLHRRIALAIVDRIGHGPERLVLGFMIASAFLSMWISNTATTAMMLPIALAIAEVLRPSDREGPYEFGIGLMLAIAYASTLGGITTLIGTPPNAVLAGAAQELLGVQISFVDWMMVALPFSVVLLPIVWLLLTRVLYPAGDVRGDAAALLARERASLGRMSATERWVATVFALTAAAWLLRSPKQLGSWTLPGLSTWLPGLRDSTISIWAALLLFSIPVGGSRAIDWATAKRLPWDVVLLFGGGFSLAAAMESSGLARTLGNSVAALDLPLWLLLGVVAALFVFLTEITSNVATATMAMPVMAGVAGALRYEPLTLMATAALASSMAFMLPVATPPNAIVFGSGYITVRQMARAGFFLNLVAIALLMALAQFVLPRLAG